MRVQTPDRIDELVKIIAPYMCYNEKSHQVELLPDAPREVVEAKKEYIDWWKEQSKDA